jgi:hypothetical protein
MVLEVADFGLAVNLREERAVTRVGELHDDRMMRPLQLPSLQYYDRRMWHSQLSLGLISQLVSCSRCGKSDVGLAVNLQQMFSVTCVGEHNEESEPMAHRYSKFISAARLGVASCTHT